MGKAALQKTIWIMLMTLNIVILGSGAIGTALAKALIENISTEEYGKVRCFNTYNSQSPAYHHSQLQYFQLDATVEANFNQLKDEISECMGNIHWLINTIGTLHNSKERVFPEKRLSDFERSAFEEVMAVNVLPTVYAAKYLSGLFDKKRKCIFSTISAKVGSIEDNKLGGWYSYRASKACLNMMLKNIAIELSYSNKNLCVAALHPGTTNSPLSQPFQKNVVADKLFSPERTASQLIAVLQGLKPKDTGNFYSWDGDNIPW